MGNTKNTKRTKGKGKPQQKPKPSSVRVHVPISVSILVPIELEGFEIDDDAPHAKLAGMDVLDCTEVDNGNDLLAAALEKAKDDEGCKDAQAALMAAVHLHRQVYPTDKALLTLFQGVMEEMEI